MNTNAQHEEISNATYNGQNIVEAGIWSWYVPEDIDDDGETVTEGLWYACYTYSEGVEGDNYVGDTREAAIEQAQADFENWYHYEILDSPYTPKQVAAMRNCNPETVRRILRRPARRAKTFPDAFCVGEGRRKQWFIPREDAEAFTPRKVGKPVASGKAQAMADAYVGEHPTATEDFEIYANGEWYTFSINVDHGYRFAQFQHRGKRFG